MAAKSPPQSVLLELFHSGTVLTYKKGEFIIRPGESPPGIFYIQEGIVKAYDITKYGEENLLIIRKEQEVFPLIWAITGQERDIIYQTLTNTTVWRISKADLLTLMDKEPSILRPLLGMTLEMYRIHSERIINLEYRTVRERLISFLLTMSNRFGKKTGKHIVIDVPLRQQDIASSINASRETTSREITSLERQGLIITNSGIITLLRPRALRSYL